MADKPMMPNDKWWSQVEDIVYSTAEFIPDIGTIYSFPRLAVAPRAGDEKRFWTTVVNSLQGSVRDVLLVSGTEEAVPIPIVHTMAEKFTEKLVDIFTSPSSLPKEITVKHNNLVSNRHHVLVGGKSLTETNRSAQVLFSSKLKGVYHYHGSVFSGKLNYDPYAKDETVFLSLPDGLVDGGWCTFTWRWTSDAWKAPKRSEKACGRIYLIQPDGFRLVPNFGYYTFAGRLTDKDTIKLWMEVAGSKEEVAKLDVKLMG